MSLPRRAMEQMGFAICCLTCDEDDVAGSPRCKSCISSHIRTRDKIADGPAESKADRLSREFVTMLAKPIDYIDDPIHGETMAQYKMLIDAHHGLTPATTTEEIQAKFEALKNKKSKSLIRNVASNRVWGEEVLGDEEREELLIKIAGEPKQKIPTWEELLEEVGDLLDSD